MTDLERVARAINEAANKRYNAYMISRDEALELARAALLAIREPSERMVHAGDKQIDQGYRDGGTIWTAMIDAILESKP